MRLVVDLDLQGIRRVFFVITENDLELEQIINYLFFHNYNCVVKQIKKLLSFARTLMRLVSLVLKYQVRLDS